MKQTHSARELGGHLSLPAGKVLRGLTQSTATGNISDMSNAPNPPPLPLNCRRFPPELLSQVCDHLLLHDQKRTLASMLRCSLDTYDLVAPLLYRDITMTRANASGIFSGPSTTPVKVPSNSKESDVDQPRHHLGSAAEAEFSREWSSLRNAAPRQVALAGPPLHFMAGRRCGFGRRGRSG